MQILIEKQCIVEINSKDMVCNQSQNRKTLFFAFEKVNVSELKKDDLPDFAKTHKGILVYIDLDHIEVYNDPFASVPLYMANRRGQYLLTTDFESCYDYAEGIDRVGIYETLLYGSGIGIRTIFNNIQQFPAASRWVLDENGGRILPYWNYTVLQSADMKEEAFAAAQVYLKLKEIFSKYKGKKIVMGLSGGVDSRLSACMLAGTGQKDVMLYTFGYNRHIKEYRIACAVAKKLGFAQPHFIPLKAIDYINSNSLSVPIKTGGGIALNHMHMYRCLSEYDSEDNAMALSNYYSDAVMGWDARAERKKESLEESDYYNMLQNTNLGIPQEVRREIEKDLVGLAERYPGDNGNFSCMDEFIYVVERNPKFHVRLSALCREWIPVELPYADYGLLELMLSIPIKYRAEKRIEQYILNNYFFSMKDISSRRYFGRGESTEKSYGLADKIYYRTGYYIMRFLNLVNVLLACISGDRLQVLNPYQTESQAIVLNSVLWSRYQEALTMLTDGGYLEKSDAVRLSKKERRGGNTSVKYAVIGLAECIKNMNSCVGTNCIIMIR